MGKQFTLYSAEAYSEPCQESFSKGEAFSIVNYFLKKLQLGCLTRFWISLCSLNHKNKQTYLRPWKTSQAESNDIKKQSSRGILWKGYSYKFHKIHRKTPVPDPFFNNVTGLRLTTLLKKTLAQVFTGEFCEIFMNSFSYKTPLVAASGLTCKANSSNLSIQDILCLLISWWFFLFNQHISSAYRFILTIFLFKL